MPLSRTSSDILTRVSALCREAVQAQRDRERIHGYGLDDYSDGRIVGAANLARKLMRLLEGTGEDVPASSFRDFREIRRQTSLVG